MNAHIQENMFIVTFRTPPPPQPQFSTATVLKVESETLRGLEGVYEGRQPKRESFISVEFLLYTATE